MSSQMSLAIKQLVEERGISIDLIQKTVEEALIAAYKRKYGTAENAVVRFSEDGDDVTIFAQKSIVDEVEDSVEEISLEEAKQYNEESEIGDELLIEINPLEFDRISIQSAKQKARQTLREIQKDTLYSEFKEKVGEMVIGYYQRERNGTIFVDLGKTEGILPKRYQSPREIYHANDRIKALIYEVTKNESGLQIVLSRTHTDFVKRIFELEVPEVFDHTVEIFKLVREPGYRTKVAARSNREDVDPVGACVGLKGVRIQAIVRELEGEKIDILKYDPDPRTFIKNALSPADVRHVVLLDESKKQALAVVSEEQFSLAIGKQGLNVRLANRLVDWNIDVKTEQQFDEMDISADTKRAVSVLFGDIEEEEITRVAELPGVSDHIVAVLASNKIELLEEIINMDEAALTSIEGISKNEARQLLNLIDENIEIVEEEADEESEEEEEPEGAAAESAEAVSEKDAEEEVEEAAVEETEGAKAESVEEVSEAEAEEAAEEETEEVAEAAVEEDTYECPDCGAVITADMAACPSCGVGLSFEVEEEASDEED